LDRKATGCHFLLSAQDSPSGKVGTVCFDTERAGIVRRGQYWSGGDRGLQGVKGRLFFGSPMPFHIILSEVEEGMGMMREVLDESTVEVGKAIERLNFLLVGRDGPFSHSGHLSWIHLYGVVGYDHPEIFHLGLLELTLVRLQEEFVLLEERQDSTGDSPVLFQCLREYQDVI
jgi:hypothetical protein